MSTLHEIAKRQEEKFMSHVRPSIVELCEKESPISLETYGSILINSYEQKYIHPFLSDEALVWNIENSIKNSSDSLTIYQLPTTYDKYLRTDGLNELLKRFKERL